MLLFVDGFVVVDKRQVGFGCDMCGTSVPLKIICTFFCHPILKRAHALNHFPLYLRSAVYVIHGQEVFWHWGKNKQKAILYYFFAQYISCLSSNGHNHIHFATTDCCDAFLDCLSIHLNYCLTLRYINPPVPTEQKSCFLKYVWLKLFVEHFVLFLNYLFSVCVKM